MRATIRNYVQAEKARREESGEAGFSLIELIVVVVILGILAAVAIPIFLNIQEQAKQSAADAIAGNAASQAASQLAQGVTPSFANMDITAPDTIAIAGPGGAAAYTIDDFCVTATVDGKTADSGPGC